MTGGRLGAGRLAAVLLLTLAAGSVLLSGGGAPVPAGGSDLTGELVTRTTLSCPGLSTPAGVTTGFTVGSAPVPGLPADGTVEYAAPGVPARVVDLRRGDSRRLAGAPTRDGAVVDATGAIAAGLFGLRADRGDGTLAAVRCPAPGASWWFTGAGATLDHSSRLVVSNVDPGPAVVDIAVFGRDGRVPSVGTAGITIAPGGRIVLRLSDVAPQSDELAVSVTADRGRVVAAVADSLSTRAARPPGHEWIPSQVTASRVVRLSGLPVGPGDRTLLLANPAEREAVVELQVSTATGAFLPAGFEPVRVPPGSVVSVDVTDVLDRRVGALRISSSLPVLAGLRSVTGADISYAAVVAPFGARGVAPLPRGARPTVLLTAGGLGGTATVTVHDAAGTATADRDLVIAPGATVRWSPAPGGAYLMVHTIAGSVHGAVALAGGGSAQVPLTRLGVRVPRPEVRPAP